MRDEEQLNREELHAFWLRQIFTFPHEVTLYIRGALDIEPVVQSTHQWLHDQGWTRGASSHTDTDWGVDYRDNGQTAVFGFHDPQKAMLFKLTWSDYL